MSNDLLALLVEVTSVPASGRQMRKPIELPRPSAEKPNPRHRTPEQTDAAMRKGISVLAASSKRVAR